VPYSLANPPSRSKGSHTATSADSTRIRTSSGPTSGTGSVVSVSVSGPPNRSMATAFMVLFVACFIVRLLYQHEGQRMPPGNSRAKDLWDGGTVGHPSAVEAVRNADGQADRRDRIAAEVARVEDHDIAPVAAGVVDVGQDAAIILAAGVGTRD